MRLLGLRWLVSAVMLMWVAGVLGQCRVSEGIHVEESQQQKVCIGVALWQAGHDSKAEMMLKQALCEAQEASTKLVCTELLTEILQRYNRQREAIDVSQILLSDVRILRDSALSCRALSCASRQLESSGRYTEAYRLLERADSIATAMCDTVLLGIVEADKANTLLEGGDLYEAMRNSQLSQLHTPPYDMRGQTYAMTLQARVLARMGEFQQAYERLDRSREVADELWREELWRLNATADPLASLQREELREKFAQEQAEREAALSAAESRFSHAAALAWTLGVLLASLLCYIVYSAVTSRRKRAALASASRSSSLNRRMAVSAAHVCQEAAEKQEALLEALSENLRSARTPDASPSALAREGDSEEAEASAVQELSLNAGRNADLLRGVQALLSGGEHTEVNVVRLVADELSLQEPVAERKEVRIESRLPSALTALAIEEQLRTVLHDVLSCLLFAARRGTQLGVGAVRHGSRASIVFEAVVVPHAPAKDYDEEQEEDALSTKIVDEASSARAEPTAPQWLTNAHQRLAMLMARRMVENNGGELIVEQPQPTALCVTLVLNR